MVSADWQGATSRTQRHDAGATLVDPQARWAAAVSDDGQLNVWELPSGRWRLRAPHDSRTEDLDRPNTSLHRAPRSSSSSKSWNE